MDDIIRNTVLKVTSEDVRSESDVEKLVQWRLVLEEKYRLLKARESIRRIELNACYDGNKKRELSLICELRGNTQLFLSLIHNRIKELRKEGKIPQRRYINELKLFRQIAKEKLPRELYDEIKKEAKELNEDKAQNTEE